MGTRELGNHPDTKMPKEKRPISSDDSDSGPEDRAPLPKSQKKSLHKEAPAKPKSSSAGGASSGGGASDDKDADGNPMWDFVEITTVWIFCGSTEPSSRCKYWMVTWVLPSGRNHQSNPLLRTSVSFLPKRVAMECVKG